MVSSLPPYYYTLARPIDADSDSLLWRFGQLIAEGCPIPSYFLVFSEGVRSLSQRTLLDTPRVSRTVAYLYSASMDNQPKLWSRAAESRIRSCVPKHRKTKRYDNLDDMDSSLRSTRRSILNGLHLQPLREVFIYA